MLPLMNSWLNSKNSFEWTLLQLKLVWEEKIWKLLLCWDLVASLLISIKCWLAHEILGDLDHSSGLNRRRRWRQPCTFLLWFTNYEEGRVLVFFLCAPCCMVCSSRFALKSFRKQTDMSKLQKLFWIGSKNMEGLWL